MKKTVFGLGRLVVNIAVVFAIPLAHSAEGTHIVLVTLGALLFSLVNGGIIWARFDPDDHPRLAGLLFGLDLVAFFLVIRGMVFCVLGYQVFLFLPLLFIFEVGAWFSSMTCLVSAFISGSALSLVMTSCTNDMPVSLWMAFASYIAGAFTAIHLARKDQAGALDKHVPSASVIQLNEFVNVLPFGAAVLDEKRQIKTLNNALRGMLDSDGNGLEGRLLDDVLREHEWSGLRSDLLGPASGQRELAASNLTWKIQGRTMTVDLFLKLHMDTGSDARSWLLFVMDRSQEEVLQKRAERYARWVEELQEALRKRKEELRAIQRISDVLSRYHDLDEVLGRVLNVISSELDARKVSIMMFDPKKRVLTIRKAIGIAAHSLKSVRFKIGEGIAGYVASKRKAVLVQDVEKDPRFFKISSASYRKGVLLCAPIIFRRKLLGVVNAESVRRDDFADEDLSLLTAIANQTAVAIESTKLYDDLNKSYLATMNALAQVIEAKDEYTKGHSERVTNIAVLIAEEMGLDVKQINSLRKAGSLHDIGKVGIPGDILNKPGKLTPLERSIIRSHPVIGERIIKRIDFLSDITSVVRHHHERFDGSGYPDALKNGDISILARILGVADAYDAMTSDRPYRKAMGRDKAISELKEYSGSQFDPAVVEAFLRVANAVDG